VRSSDASKLGIRDLIREGRTAFAGSVPEKQHNIALAASRLDGVVVAPGALFSFNREVGPTTLEAGFQTGWGITLSSTGARTIPSVAGGICQVATTLFQPVFHAGYQIEQRNWHLYWINSYGQPPLGMKGLDATVDEEAGLDLQFINNTDNYLLIQSRVEGSTLVFGLYGTKPSWDVKVDGPAITNVRTADTTQVRQAEPTMPVGRSLAVESAQDGFDATITRTVTQGDNVRTLRLTSKYIPSRNVVLYGTGGA
jgi:vancomycin resistance protein YoaR